MNQRTEAVLWDFDGTLVDTEPYWIDAEYALIESYGAAWSQEHALALVGNDLIESARYIIEHTGIPLTPVEVVDRLLDGVVAQMLREVPWRPGARELLADLRAHDVRCGLVTMSYQRLVAPALAALPEGTFECVVTGERVSRGKPHPDPYLQGAELLGVPAPDCLAIEDSNTGATSAQAAGCRVVVVPNHVLVTELPGRTFVDGLAGLDARALLALG